MFLRSLIANLPTETDSPMSLMIFSFSLSMNSQRLKGYGRGWMMTKRITLACGELKEETSRVKKQMI